MGSGTLAPWVRMTGQWGIGATVGCGLPVVGNGNSASGGVAQRKRRRKPVAPILRACRACWQRSSGVGPSAGLAPKDLDIATHDLGDNGWVLFHVGKQDHGDDGAGKSLRI